jgi:pyrimidine deaminase RibD-like protein
LLIREKLSPGYIYPQLTQLPANYTDFLAAFRDGQTVDNNTYLTIANTLQTSMCKTALGSGHLTTRGNPIQGESLVDIFLTDKGADHILVPQERQLCELAVELAKKSIHENDGKLHPYVGAVVVKDGKIISTGFRGETGEGRHAEFCALKKLNEDVDHVDLSGCTVYTTLEPCSERKSGKTACATRLINAKAARVVRPPKDAADGFFTVEDAKKNVFAYGRTIEEIAVEWRKIDADKVIAEKLVRQTHGGSNRLLLFN